MYAYIQSQIHESDVDVIAALNFNKAQNIHAKAFAIPPCALFGSPFGVFHKILWRTIRARCDLAIRITMDRDEVLLFQLVI